MSGLVPPLYRLYIQIWKLHISEVTQYFPSSLWDWINTADSVQCLWAWYLSQIGKKRRGLENYKGGSPGGRFASLHGQPYPAAPEKLFHVQQVDSQSGLQLVTQTLLVPAVRAVHGHAQEWHQQEEASEQGEVGARWIRLIGWEQKREVYWAAVNGPF